MAACKNNLRALLTLTVLIGAATTAAASPWRFENVDRIVALSDIHGAYGPMVAALQNAGVLDDQLTWSGESAHLVVVGDILDRGPESRRAMDLLMRLETESTLAGGMVHVLIGNHEAMNLIGDLRYVSEEEYAAFAADEDPEDREHWFREYSNRRATGKKSARELRAAFDQSFPSGFFAHRRAFSSEGKYGNWLLSKPIIVVINDTAFVHGGLPPMLGEVGIDVVNGRLRSDMVGYVHYLEVLVQAGALLPTDNFHHQPDLLDGYFPRLDSGNKIRAAMSAVRKLNDSVLHSKEGPLWYRGNIACSSLIEVDRLGDSLRAVGAKRVVIGHTPTPNRRVLERFDGLVIEVDTGMLKGVYKGSANVLVIENDKVFVVNENSDEPIAPMPHPRYVGRRPGGFLEAGEIEDLLENGAVMSKTKNDSGQIVVSLSDGKRTLDAIFTGRLRRGIYPEVAAYRLDLLLGLDMVPVTVKRELDGKDGSLQFLPRAWIDELQRKSANAGGSAQCPLSDQWSSMFVFDSLILHRSRSAQTIRYDRGNFQMMLVGHGRSFDTGTGRPRRLKNVTLQIGPSWREVLSSLTDEVLDEELGDVLDDSRLRALGARRDILLSESAASAH